MKIIVDTKNYALFDYDEYTDGGTPDNNPYVIGQVVAIKEDNRSGDKGHWTLGVVIGCITPHEVRTDMHGMVPLEDIRPAVISDFDSSIVNFTETLYNECNGKDVSIKKEKKELGEFEFECVGCGKVHTKNSYAIAQGAMGVAIVHKCECGARNDL